MYFPGSSGLHPKPMTIIFCLSAIHCWNFWMLMDCTIDLVLYVFALGWFDCSFHLLKHGVAQIMKSISWLLGEICQTLMRSQVGPLM